MQCVKTGAVIFLAEYREYGRCDVFLINGVWIFRVTEGSISHRKEHCTMAGGDIGWTIHRINHTFNDAKIRTIIAHDDEVETHASGG